MLNDAVMLTTTDIVISYTVGVGLCGSQDCCAIIYTRYKPADAKMTSH